jgi:hypothetical protein
MSTAFQLRADLAGTVTVYATQADKDEGNGQEVPAYTGGVIAVGDGEFDLGAALDEGDGTIVVDDADYALVNALDEYPALKRVAAPDAGADEVDDLDRLGVRDLRRLAGEAGLEGAGRANRDALITAIRTKRQLDAEAATGSEADKLRASETDSVDDAQEG